MGQRAGDKLWDSPDDAAAGAESGRLLTAPQGIKIATPSDAVRHVRSLGPAGGRSLVALYVDRTSSLLATEIIELGSGGWAIKPMRFIAQAERLSAMGFIIVRDVPQGKIRPMRAELEMARELRRQGEELDRYLIHYLVAEDGRIREVGG